MKTKATRSFYHCEYTHTHKNTSFLSMENTFILIYIDDIRIELRTNIVQRWKEEHKLATFW